MQPLRFENEWSKRSQPPANLPDGVNHKLSSNYYFNRDARRLVSPPLVIKNAQVEKQPKQISS